MGCRERRIWVWWRPFGVADAGCGCGGGGSSPGLHRSLGVTTYRATPPCHDGRMDSNTCTQSATEGGAELSAAFRCLTLQRAKLDAEELMLIVQLVETSTLPERDLVAASGCSVPYANRLIARSRVAGFGQSGALLVEHLREGAVTAVYLDRYGGVRATLPAALRDEFDGEAQGAVADAPECTLRTFGRRLRLLVRRLEERHGIDRLERQRRHSRLDERTDPDTGMCHFHLMVDPLTGLDLSHLIDHRSSAMFAGRRPETCPEDPLAVWPHLRALALVDLLTQPSTNPVRLRREVLVVIDTTRLDEHGDATVDWGLPVELPAAVLAHFVAQRDRLTVVDVRRDGRVVDQTDQLNLGRSRREPTRAQRRLLRARHPHCTEAGCEVPFDRCDLHHTVPWQEGGTTDVDNLEPKCPRHHQHLHEQAGRVA